MTPPFPNEPIALTPVGVVRGGRTEPTDDGWDGVEAAIHLDPARFAPDAVRGLEAFSHVTVVFHFHRADPDKVDAGARHPRGNAAWPRVGIFAQRGKARPNLLGVTTCRLLGLDGLVVRVRGLDAIDGTPVLDLKPHMSGFAPRGEIVEPDWAREIMAAYWAPVDN